MHRRSILAMFGGGVASAASGISVKDAAEAIGAEDALQVGGPLPPSQEAVGGQLNSRLSRALQAVYREREINRSHADHRLPAHIACMKSWSPAFKVAVHKRETEIIDAFIERVERDEQFAGKVAGILGLPGSRA